MVKQDNKDVLRRAQKKIFIDFIQVVSMILIVLSHSFPNNIGGYSGLLNIIPYLQEAGLAVFMCSSAYLTIYTNALEKYGYKRYLFKRFIRLLVPYFVMSILMIIPKWLLSQYSSVEVTLNPLLILYQLITPRNGILPHLWFVVTLFILSIITPLLLWCCKKKIGCISILLGGFAILFIPNLTDVMCVNDIIDYYFWYSLGLIFALYEEKLLRINFLLIVGSGSLLVCIPLYFFDISTMYWTFYSIASVSLIIVVGVLFEQRKKLSLDWIKKYTFSIYILSLPIQNVVEILCVKLQLYIVLIIIIMFIVGLMLPVLIGCIVEFIEKKWKVKPLSKIIGM